MTDLVAHDIVDSDSIWIILVVAVSFDKDTLAKCGMAIVEPHAHDFSFQMA